MGDCVLQRSILVALQTDLREYWRAVFHTALGLRRRWERGRVRGSVKEVVADVSTSRFRPVRGLTNDTKPQKLRKNCGEI